MVQHSSVALARLTIIVMVALVVLMRVVIIMKMVRNVVILK